MLTHLSINHLTLVDHLELEFRAGMSVITGETGAGKSILLGALGLALGDRADSSLIAREAEKTEINATFDLKYQPEATSWLKEKELDDGDECILRRVVSKDGRSRAFVNGSAMTLAELRSLSEMLLDVHSQHEHQSLLKKETHRRLLDEFGGLTEVVEELGRLFNSLETTREELEALLADKQAQSARVQLLAYQAEELSALALKSDETEGLETELKQLTEAESNQERLAGVQRLCDGEYDDSASSLATRALNTLNNIDDDRLAGVKELLDSAVIQMDEAMSELGDLLEKFEADPDRQSVVEERLSAIYEIARKHRVNPQDLAELAEDIEAELAAMVNADARIDELGEELGKRTKQYNTLAEKLTRSRTSTAQLLQGEVTSHLHSLGMQGARFQVNLAALPAPGRHGADDIEFRIATLPGAEPGSLSKIASGGELSRISLAIQVVAAQTSNTPTLIFDEVDVGVGGPTAEIVGSLLRQLGTKAQVICVTHLAQVAAQGHNHYVVAKSTTDRQASTTVSLLTEEEKVDEIARMLGGVKKTDQSLAHAQAMLQDARSG